MTNAKRDEIIHWHQRYYGPNTIAHLVSEEVGQVQKVIYEYEEALSKGLRRVSTR